MTNVHTRNARTFSIANFDLVEYIRTFPQADVAAQMAQGLAWKIDTMLQQNSREIFKFVRDDLFRKGVDGLSELSIALREAEFAAQSFTEAGSHTAGAVQTIGHLNYLREGAHNMAAELTALTTDWKGQPYTYQTPELDDVFHAEVKMKLKNNVRSRMVKSTERHAQAYGLDQEEIKALVAKKIDRKLSQLRDVGVTLEEQASAVFELYRIASQRTARAPGDELNFWELDTAVQRQLIEHTMQSADRAEDRATDNDNLTEAQFDDISMAALTVNKDMKSIIDSPRFKIAQQVADAATI